MQGKKKLIPAGQADFKIEKRGIGKDGKFLDKSPEGIDWGTHADQKDKEFRLLITDRAKDEKPKAIYFERIAEAKVFKDVCILEARCLDKKNLVKFGALYLRTQLAEWMWECMDAYWALG
jgi:hypothetical protein